MNIIDRIKELANAKNVSLAEVERRAGLSSGSITKWGKSSPSADKLEKVAELFEVSTDYLIGRTDRKDPWPASMPEEDFGDITDEKMEDLKKMVENAQTFDGQELDQHDKDAIVAFIAGRLSGK